jgi:AAA+ ATPase superfamily predicted ATPase
MSNPFFYGGHVKDPTQFAGRDGELRRIFAGLETASNGQAQHFSIVGPRRIGKSSLIYHVAQIYKNRLAHPEKYFFVYINLDDPRCHKLSGLLHFILQKLDIEHQDNPSLEIFINSIDKFREEKDKIPVLCFDEFEHLIKHKGEFPDHVFEAWRSMGTAGQVVFITVSKSTLDELIQQGNLTSQFYNIFTLLVLGEFSEEGVMAFLSIGKNCDRPFTSNEIDRVIELAGCHPAKLQIICNLLYDAKSSSQIDWSELEAEYHKQIKYLFKKTNYFLRIVNYSHIFFNFVFVIMPRAVGRFFLDIFNRDRAQESTALLVGWIVIVVAIIILLGRLDFNELLELFKGIWLFFFPPKI